MTEMSLIYRLKACAWLLGEQEVIGPKARAAAVETLNEAAQRLDELDRIISNQENCP